MEAELGDVRSVHLALFTGRGDTDDALREQANAGRVLLFMADDLLVG
jgi:hypothetical protein